jgi:hypothetical protein
MTHFHIRHAVLALISAASISLVATTAQANCSLSIEPSQTVWEIQFDPTQDERATNSFDVAFVNLGSSDCKGTTKFELSDQAFGLSTPELGERIEYQLLDDRNGVDVTPNAGGRSAARIATRTINVQPGERKVVRFTLKANPSDQAGHGVYSQNVELLVSDSTGLPVAQRSLVFGINIPHAAVIGLRGEFQRVGGTPTIQLGELVSGEKSLNTALFVGSTGGYSVTVSSANNWALVIPSTDWKVPYNLMLGSTAMNLTQVSSHQVVSRRARADFYKLSVNIGSVSGKRAGNYSDTLTFTVSAF